jgi:hypothetical protein
MQDPANIHTIPPRREPPPRKPVNPDKAIGGGFPDPPPRKPHDPVYDPPLTAYEQMRERHIAQAVRAWPEPPPRKRN